MGDLHQDPSGGVNVRKKKQQREKFEDQSRKIQSFHRFSPIISLIIPVKENAPALQFLWLHGSWALTLPVFNRKSEKRWVGLLFVSSTCTTWRAHLLGELHGWPKCMAGVAHMILPLPKSRSKKLTYIAWENWRFLVCWFSPFFSEISRYHHCPTQNQP